jgi:hypothetical protein
MPFFNQGLMSGQSKVGKVSSKPFSDCMLPVYALQKEAVEGANHREEALAQFYSRNKESLDEVSQKGYFSFHSPTEYAGLEMTHGKRDTVTYTQRKIARIAESDALRGFSVRRPECLDDKWKPYFSHRPVHGPTTLHYSSLRRVEYPQISSPQILTPFIESMYGDVDPEGESRVCTSRDLRRYYQKRIKRERPIMVSANKISRGFTVLSPPSIRPEEIGISNDIWKECETPRNGLKFRGIKYQSRFRRRELFWAYDASDLDSLTSSDGDFDEDRVSVRGYSDNDESRNDPNDWGDADRMFEMGEDAHEYMMGNHQ